MTGIASTLATRLRPMARRGVDVIESKMAHATVVENRHVADRYWLLRIHAPEITRRAGAGHFVMVTVALDGEATPTLPRPMAVYAVHRATGCFDIMYGVLGAGTRALTRFLPGGRITVVGPMGRGFRLEESSTRILLIGRGIGTCSLTVLATDAVAAGVTVTALDSARTAHALVADAEYQRAGVERRIQVLDSDGTSDPARVRDRLVREFDAAPPQQIFVCGSNRLTHLTLELAERWGSAVQVSLEAHMACGLGYCHGCSTGTRGGGVEAPLICADGPVFAIAGPADADGGSPS